MNPFKIIDLVVILIQYYILNRIKYLRNTIHGYQEFIIFIGLIAILLKNGVPYNLTFRDNVIHYF